jgi:hypothetical protein
LTVKDNEEEETFSCVDAEATVKAHCGSGLVSFSTETLASGYDDMQYVHIPATVEAKVDDEFANCGISYKLLVKDGDNWISWDSMVDILLADNPVLTSTVEFDKTTADFEAAFTKSDYDSHSQRFTGVDPNDPTVEEVAMYFRSIIIVPTSSYNGATIADADQPAFADFKVTFVNPE